MSAPVWPDGLQDGTPLPFSVWRVMHHVDGQRDISEVARLAGMTVPDVQERLNAAAAWIARATQRDLPISDDLAERISQCLTGVVGPMAAVMVDEVLDDPQVRHRQMVVEIDHPRLGSLKSIGSPIKLSETPPRVYRHPPDLGEHTEEVLSRLDREAEPDAGERAPEASAAAD